MDAWAEITTTEQPQLPVSQVIALAEQQLLSLPQSPCPVLHRFGPGLYFRELHVPAGTFIIGHHQNFEHMNMFLKGRVSVLNDDGSVSELTAPMMFVGKPGRKVGFVHEDMIWTNIYADTETDVEKLEAKYLTKSVTFLRDQDLRRDVDKLKIEIDHKDFITAITELGFTEGQVRAISTDERDMIPLPHGAYKIKIGPSVIEGKGIFATSDIAQGEWIAPARIGGKRTIVGRFTNHSAVPNAKFTRGGNDIFLVATKPIAGCHGGQDGEEITVDYRASVSLNRSIGEGICQESR